MKKTDVNIFYQLGASLTYFMDHLHVGDQAVDLYILLQMPLKWFVAFRSETSDLADAFRETCAVVDHFITAFHGLMNTIPNDWNRPVLQEEVTGLSYWKDQFEEALGREYRNLDVFTVTPKGLYNTRLLIQAPESDFPPELRPALPEQVLYDLGQAARCLAFDVPTACAFHVCRGTEALMLAYYAKLAGHEWNLPKNREWSQYIDHLHKEGAPTKITERLREIKDSNRNALIHPDIIDSPGH